MEEYTEPHPIEVVWKFRLPEHEDEMNRMQHANIFYSALMDIDQKCRTLLKYGENVSDEMEQFAEEIREICHQADIW